MVSRTDETKPSELRRHLKSPLQAPHAGEMEAPDRGSCGDRGKLEATRRGPAAACIRQVSADAMVTSVESYT